MKWLAMIFLSFQTFLHAEYLVIGIAGGTGSGKTTMAAKIQEAFPGQSILISQDSYYKACDGLSLAERSQVNFDHPDALDFDLLVYHLNELKQGRPIQKPVYNFRTHSRESYTEKVSPNQIIIVEGILLFAIPELCDSCDLKIFIDTDDDVRLLRRIERDMRERGRSLESICDQYLSTVKPMHEAFVQPSKKKADLIVPHGGENKKAFHLIKATLNDQIETKN